MITEITSIGNSIGTQYKKPNSSDLQMYSLNMSLLENSQAKDFLRITKNLTDETINSFNVGYDQYRDNVTIPETKNGEVINVAYRALENNPKVKYGKEKGCENWIFNEKGIDEAKKKGSVLVLSNQFDVMSAVQSGILNVVSIPVGKDGVGIWMELFDNIPKIYTCFENTKQSKKYALDFSERVGSDKCYEIALPTEIIDLNDFFKKNDIQTFREYVKNAKPYYTYKFKGLGDIIDFLRVKNDNLIKLDCVPFMEFEEDWLTIFSGTSNVGKTSYLLNVACELGEKKLPTLILPFERGIKSVGKRFLQIFTDKNNYVLDGMGNTELDKLLEDVNELPIYFSIPTREQIKDTIARAKKIFGIKVVIVDHLDYLVRKSTENHNVETSNTLQEFKSLAQEFGVIFMVVHHMKKPEGGVPKKPKMEDLKGSSSTYQDPEAVIMLSSQEKGQLEIDIVKNKGEMGSMIFNFNPSTGRVGKPINETPEVMTDKQKSLNGFDKF